MKRHVFTLTLAFALVALALASTSGAARNAAVFPPQAHPYGHTYGEWAAAWWPWALSQPASTNPVLDQTGAYCANGQKGKVWFLAGSFSSGAVNRSCTVPEGTALLVPIINSFYCAAPTDPPEQQTEEYVRSQVSFVADAASGLSATIDGTSVPDIQARYLEESALFEVVLPADNIFGDPGLAGIVFRPCADAGHYLMVRPLPPGEHTIHFVGSLGDFSLDVTYQLTVGG